MYRQPIEEQTVILNGKIALVTGASQGIGRAAAIALFGAVTTSAVTYLITDNALDEALVARTIQSILLEGLRPR